MKWRSHTISGDNSVRECFEKINSLSPKFLVVLKIMGVLRTLSQMVI